MGLWGAERPLLERPTRVYVVGIDGPESLMAATPIALGLEAAGHTVTLAGPPCGWADSIAEWYAEQARPVRVVAIDADAGADAELTLAVGGAPLLAPDPELRARLEALRARGEAWGVVLGLGAEAADGADPALARAALMRVAAVGGLVDTQPILRFSSAGRQFVELVEHVHHRAGPTAQSVVADSLRAALFGVHGARPVSLATRERAPALDPLTTIAFVLSIEELLR